MSANPLTGDRVLIEIIVPFGFLSLTADMRASNPLEKILAEIRSVCQTSIDTWMLTETGDQSVMTVESWAKLVTLIGHYKDASDVTVKLFWDDATGDACVKVGKNFYAARSFELAIEKAYAAEPKP